MFPAAGTVIVLAVLHSTPVAPTRPSVLPGLYLTHGILQALDVHSSLLALEHGGTREGNPLLRGMTPETLVAVKVAGVVTTLLLSEYLWRHGHRRTAVLTLLALNLATGIVVMHNYHLARH